MASSTDSWTKGESTPALLEETIGDNLDAHRRAYADREALVDVRERAALDLGGAAGRRRRRRARPGRRGHPQGRPGRHLGAELRRVDAGAVRHREGRRDPGQHQPGLPHPRVLPTSLNQAGIRLLVAATSFKTSDYRAMVDETAAENRALERVVYIGDEESWAGPAGRRRGRLAPTTWPQRAASLDAGRPDQHPVHLRHHRLPQGRDPQPPQHPQQRLLRRRGVPLHRGRPGLHPGALLPLLRHGHGQPRVLPPTGPAW